jgi:hypothetical protein
MRATLAAVLLVGAMTTATDVFAREPQRPVEEARARVQHHLQEVNVLTDHFEGVLRGECPQFASAVEWRAYLDGEVERVVLLLAHLEQAWIEAKGTDDDDVRRAAKAPRRRVDQARALLGKLSGCASGSGASISQGELWRRIEREVPQRQAEIALPSEGPSPARSEAAPASAPVDPAREPSR